MTNAKYFIRHRFNAAVIAAMLAVVPFIFYIGPGSFILPRVMIIELAACFLAAMMIFAPPETKMPVRLPLIAFILVCALASLRSPDLLISIKPMVFTASCAIIAWAVFATASLRTGAMCFSAIIAATGAVMAVHGIFQYFGFDFSALKGIPFKVFGTAGTPASLAGYLAASLVILFSYICISRKFYSIIALLCLWFVMSLCLVMSASRSGLIAAAAGFATAFSLILFLSGIDKRNVVIRFLACAALFALAMSAAWKPYSAKELSNDGRVSPLMQTYNEDLKAGSIKQRRFTMLCGYEIWKEHPFLGSGAGTFAYRYPLVQAELLKNKKIRDEYGDVVTDRIATHAHNEYLELADECGALGLVAFLVLAFISASKMLNKIKTDYTSPRRHRALRCGMLGAFVSLLVLSAFEFTLHDPLTAMLFWSILGLGLASRFSARTDAAPNQFRGPVRAFLTLAYVICLAMISIVAVNVPRPLIAMLRMTHANSIAMRGRIVEATDELKAAHVIDPSSVEVLMNLSLAYRLSGNYSDAIHTLHSALSLSNNPEIYFAAGSTNFRAGFLPEAEKAFTTALEIDPWRPATLFNLSIVYYREGRRGMAIDTMRRAMALTPAVSQQRPLLLKYLHCMESGQPLPGDRY